MSKFEIQMPAKSTSAILIVFLLLISFQNCAPSAFSFLGSDTSSIEASSSFDRDTPYDSNDLITQKTTGPGKVLFRPRCFMTVVNDFDSYCRVSVAGGISVVGAGVDVDAVVPPSCEIVLDGTSHILRLNGPQYIGSDVNYGALFLNYKDYMSRAEYDTSSIPCDIAVARAAAAQDQAEREAAEHEWGVKMASSLYKTFQSQHQSFDLRKNVMSNFTEIIGISFNESLYPIHCSWYESRKLIGGKCGKAALPRWIEAPAAVVEYASQFKSPDFPSIDQELVPASFCRFSKDCD